LLVRQNERGDTFGMTPQGEKKPEEIRKTSSLFWGLINLDQCTKNLEIKWDVQTGCKMGLRDNLEVQWQMNSATSTQCKSNNKRCYFNRDEVSEVESGWWKRLHDCRGANPFSELDGTGHLIIPRRVDGAVGASTYHDCGFGGICGSTSTWSDGVRISNPMCPYPSLGPGSTATEVTSWFPIPSNKFSASTTLAASDPNCGCNANRQGVQGQECYDAPEFPQDCMCSGAGSSCTCKNEFYTSGEYVLKDPFASAEIDCPKTKNTTTTSCRVSALLKMQVKIDSPLPSFEHFKIKDLRVSCDSDFVLTPGVVSDDGHTISCPLPQAEQGDGTQGFLLELSLNGKDWEEPIDFPYLESPRVISIEPKFGISSGGTKVTVTGQNFVDDPPIYCFWIGLSTNNPSIKQFRNQTIRVLAEFVSTTRYTCVAPSVDEAHNINAGGVEPFTALHYAVYVSLNGREPGPSIVNGSSQELSFNYFRTPKIEAVTPDTGFTSQNQSITVYGTHMCLHHSPQAKEKSCRLLMVKMTHPAYCTHASMPGAQCKEVVLQGKITLPHETRVATTGYADDVHVQIWDMKRPRLELRSNDTYVVGLEFLVEGTSVVLHSQNFTFYDSLRPPAGCQLVGDGQGGIPQELKCQCLFRDPEKKGEYRITSFPDPGTSEGESDLEFMTTVPSRRFDLCEPAPYLTTATLLNTPSSGGSMIRLGARSFPDWTRW
jgi:hypothetical protein